MRSASVALAFAFACTGTFGLEQVGVDDDGDGLVDGADNCPDMANADQEDWDLNGIGDACDACGSMAGRDVDGDGIDDACDGCVGPGRTHDDIGGDGIDDGCEQCAAATGYDIDRDGVDDACDSCLRGPEHDEDADGVADACDDCPSRPDPDQSQLIDTDRLGDACDPDSDPLDLGAPPARAQSTRLFDGFSAIGDVWMADPAWSAVGDHAIVPANTSVRPRVQIGTQFLVETVVAFEPGAQTSLLVTLDGSSCASVCQQFSTSCSIASDGTVMLVPYAGSTVTTAAAIAPGPVRVWFRSRHQTATTLVEQCIVIDRNNVVVRATASGVSAPPLIAMNVALATDAGPVGLDYVWLVAN
jgi:hypothetical protein